MAITPALLLTKQYWVNLFTIAVGAFVTSFVGFLTATTSTPSLHALEAAAWSSLVAAVGVTLHSGGVTAQAKKAASAQVAPPTVP
jgi:hypothetical protein